MVLIAAVSGQKKSEGLLVLDWAAKAQEKAPPVAVLIELGVKDTVPTPWPGSATVKGAKVVHREGYRFIKDDELIAPDAWKVSSHRPLRVPPKQPAVSKTEGLVAPGILLHLAEVTPDATLTLTLTGNDKGKAVVPLKDVLAGKSVEPTDGVAVRLVTTTAALTKGKTEDDFPAAAYGSDGTLWVAYIAYTLKEEGRRVEAENLKEQPQNFKAYDTPEFGDQLFVKSFKDGKWSEPIAVTDGKQDLVRACIATDSAGHTLVIYSAHRDGRHDLYARAVAPKLGKEQKLSGAKADNIEHLAPVACTGQSGDIHLAGQTRTADGLGVFHINGLALQENGWTARMSGSSGIGGGSCWHVAIAAGPKDNWQVACDGYVQPDYDVLLPFQGTSTRASGGKQGPAACSARYEARPSICFDAQGRLWIAYEEGPEQWGKDWGPLVPKKGNPLYSARSVRVVCLQDGKLFSPVAELPTSTVKPPQFPNPMSPNLSYEKQARYSQPQIGIDGKGRVWLTYRQKFGTRYSTHAGSYWITFARRLDGDKWTEPIEVAHSDGLLDHRPVLLPHSAGGLRIVYNGDGRWTKPETVHNHIYEGYIDLPGDPAEPKLVAHDPGTKDDKAAKEEQEIVKRIRAYRVESGSKKYQLLRGEFHRHTEISWDGGPDGSLEDMWRYAIDAAAMDWIGCGDHDNGAGREYSWWLTQKTTDAYHVKDRFTPVFSYERSVAYPHGHRNCVFARRGIRTLPRLAEPDMEKKVGGVHADDTKMLYRYLHEMGGICAVHTSATSMGTDWRDHDSVVEPIVEIYQGDRMSYEMEGAPRAGYDPKIDKYPPNIAGWYPKGFINHALQMGHKLGFQSSSDHWSTHTSFCIVLAEKHDREGIVDAMRKRHCYGATDNIILDVKSGSHVMGDEFKSNGAATIEIKVIGTAPLAKVEVLKDSEVVETFVPGKAEYSGKWTDPKPGDGKHYYYIRVQQADGELAWGSPMWVEYAK
jgi:hypothetical protein